MVSKEYTYFSTSDNIAKMIELHAASTHPRHDPNSGQHILYYGLPVRSIGIICLIVVILIIWGSFTIIPMDKPGDKIGFCFVVGFFTLGGIWSTLETFIAKVIISDEFILGIAPWPGYPRKIFWNDITMVSYNPFSNSFVLVTDKGRKVRISKYFNGIGYLARLFEKRLENKIDSKAQFVINAMKPSNNVKHIEYIVSKNSAVSIHINIDDGVIDKGDPYEVIEPLIRAVNTYSGKANYENSLARFSHEQRLVYSIQVYTTEACDGGHESFFSSPAGIVWKDALTGFHEIGIPEGYTILEESIRRLGSKLEDDPDLRRKQLELQNPRFEDLDKKLNNTLDRIDAGLMTYIKINRSKFYFDDVI